MRILKRPTEWQAHCNRCCAVLAYDLRDVNCRRIQLPDKLVCTCHVCCPHCSEWVRVPEDEVSRVLVEEGGQTAGEFITVAQSVVAK